MSQGGRFACVVVSADVRSRKAGVYRIRSSAEMGLVQKCRQSIGERVSRTESLELEGGALSSEETVS